MILRPEGITFICIRYICYIRCIHRYHYKKTSGEQQSSQGRCEKVIAAGSPRFLPDLTQSTVNVGKLCNALCNVLEFSSRSLCDGWSFLDQI